MKGDCNKCAVALAIADAMPGYKVMVAMDEIYAERYDGGSFDDHYDYKEFKTPNEVACFIIKFDKPIQQVGLKPFEFELR